MLWPVVPSIPRSRQLCSMWASGSEVEVVRAEEKGADVNLATALLVDGFNREFDVTVGGLYRKLG